MGGTAIRYESQMITPTLGITLNVQMLDTNDELAAEGRGIEAKPDQGNAWNGRPG